jgi:hypothetical protein
VVQSLIKMLPGALLNRIALLLEKTKVPHHRVRGLYETTGAHQARIAESRT